MVIIQIDVKQKIAQMSIKCKNPLEDVGFYSKSRTVRISAAGIPFGRLRKRICF
jgi:hypothetical protein